MRSKILLYITRMKKCILLLSKINMNLKPYSQYSCGKQKEPAGCLPFHWQCKVSFLIRLLLVYCFNYAFLP